MVYWLLACSFDEDGSRLKSRFTMSKLLFTHLYNVANDNNSTHPNPNPHLEVPYAQGQGVAKS